tara:strand:- start:894 stop:1487 length:594 start_codon:yes stop_codon:yes gene_type:complete
MSFTTEIKRLLKNKRLCMILAIVVFLGISVYIYNSQKGTVASGMTNHSHASNHDQDDQYPGETAPAAPGSAAVMPAMPAGMNSGPGSANGINTVTNGVPKSCLDQQVAIPSDLLPNDPNTQFASSAPVNGQGELANINLLKAGQLSGIDTVGGTLRNANLQLRSEPANPRSQVSPWMNSTIEPDLMRVPLELGCGSQ